MRVFRGCMENVEDRATRDIGAVELQSKCNSQWEGDTCCGRNAAKECDGIHSRGVYREITGALDMVDGGSVHK